MKKILFVCLCVMAISLPSHAQRLIPGQKGIEIMGGVPIIKNEKFFSQENVGLSVSISHYFKHAKYAFVLAEYERQKMPYRTYGVPMSDVFLQIGYMHPMLSDRGKNILGFLGLSGLCGYEELGENKQLLPDGATLLDRSRFVYGTALHSSMELFITDNILFVLKAQGRLLFGTDVHRFRPALSAGVKFNF